jgi:multicomponent Na+:H+ antiporter subunit C
MTVTGVNAPSLTLVVVIGVLVAAGVYLLLERSLSRVIIGVILIGNGVNLFFLVSGGSSGHAPIVPYGSDGKAGPGTPVMADPLPQAMVLTAIVITLGMTAFVLALAYRSWQLHGHDEVQDDVEDRRIATLAAQDAPTAASDEALVATSLDATAADVRDDVREGRP